MLSRYGYEFDHEGGIYAGYSASNPSKTGYNVRLSPMSYLASGQVGLDTEVLSYHGMWGFWRHNTTLSPVANAYYSSVISDSVIPSRHTARSYGYSLRFQNLLIKMLNFSSKTEQNCQKPVVTTGYDPNRLGK